MSKLIFKIKEIRAFVKQFLMWKKIAKTDYQLHTDGAPRHLVIMPADSETIGGSRGDEAMLMAAIGNYRQKYPDSTVSIVVTNGEEYIDSLQIPNLHAIPSYRGSYPLQRIFKSIIDARPTDVIVVGADCMDGHYAPYISLILLATYDLCSKVKGLNTNILGFSWNKKPSALIKWAFRSVRHNRYNLRDSVSMQRFKNDVNATNVSLVADEAFQLVPATDFDGYTRAKEWVSTHGGKLTIGLNFHPMLREYKDSDEVVDDAIKVAKNFVKVLQQYPDVTLMLISHDDRRTISDNTMLNSIYAYLCDQGFASRVYYDPKVYRSAQIKGLCELVDGMISSRMHLAIAALGQNIPILAISYQDKFEGLYRHFSYDQDMLLTPWQFMDDAFISKFDAFIKRLPQLKEIVVENNPKVLEMSRKNHLPANS